MRAHEACKDGASRCMLYQMWVDFLALIELEYRRREADAEAPAIVPDEGQAMSRRGL